MNIAIDITPIKDTSILSHRHRGTGSYTQLLITSLQQYYSKHNYLFFTRNSSVPKNADVVHYPYFEPFFLTLPFFKTRRTIVTVHDLTPLVFPSEFPVGLKGKLKWFIQKMSLHSAQIISDSISSKKDIMKYVGMPNQQVSVVYLAPSPRYKVTDFPNTIKSEIRKKYNLPEKFVLYVGDATWNKNLPRFIKAIKSLGIPLVLVGKAIANTSIDKDNLWNKDLSEIHKLVENDSTIFTPGFVQEEDLVVLYNIATVFVMPSLYEGFGLPVLEAMQSGCPVVTTHEGALKEVAEDAALIVDAYSQQSIADGVNLMFNSKKLQDEYIKKGIIQSRKFSWEKVAKETVAVYEKKN